MTTVAEVFAVGLYPRYTYNPRAGQEIEGRLRQAIEDGGRFVLVSGATKSGKTTLIESVVPEGLTISGGEISSVDDLWTRAAAKLGVGGEQTSEWESASHDDTTGEIGGGVNAGLFNFGSRVQGSTGTEERRRAGSRRTPHQGTVVLSTLIEQRRPLILDDFHHVTDAVRTQIALQLKGPVQKGLRVVLAVSSVRARNAMFSTADLGGRIASVPIPRWTDDELCTIAELGFNELHASDPRNTRHVLAHNAYQSPYLMQEFCRQLCRKNGLTETAPETFRLGARAWPAFFEEIASEQETTATQYRYLAAGPDERGQQRIQRIVIGGGVTDSYPAVLAAIGRLSERQSMTAVDVGQALHQVLTDPIPTNQEAARVMSHLAKLASLDRDVQEGRRDPVLEYDDEHRTLSILDPFFAFFLAHSPDAKLAAS